MNEIFIMKKKWYKNILINQTDNNRDRSKNL